jgi:hypothetical protein
VKDPTKEQHRFCANLGKSVTDPGNDYASVQGRKHEPYPESANSPRPKKARQVKSRVKSMLIILFDIKGIVHKEFVLAGQIINSAYYCDILWQLRENVRRLRSKLLRQKNWLLHHDNSLSHTFLFSREFLTKDIMTVVLHPPYISLFPRLKHKTERLTFRHN